MMGNEISHGQTLRDVPSEHLLSAASIAQYSYPIGRLVMTPMYPVGRPINPTTLLSADWSQLQCTLSAAPSAPPPHCRPTGHHPNHTVGRLFITPTYPVGRPINPTTSLSADWSQLQCTLSAAPSTPSPHCRPTGRHSNVPCRPTHYPTTQLPADWSSLHCTLSVAPSASPPHCRLTGHNSNVPCRPTHYPTTSLSADWSQLQCTLSAAPSTPPPQCRPTGHHPNISRRPPHQPHHPTVGRPIAPPLHCRPTGHHPKQTVGRLVITPTYPVGRPINPITPLSADWSSPKTNRRPTGDHSDVPCRPPHQPHHPTVGRLVITPTYPVGRPINPTTSLSADWSSPKQTVGRLVITPTYPVGRPINPTTSLSADWSQL